MNRGQAVANCLHSAVLCRPPDQSLAVCDALLVPRIGYGHLLHVHVSIAGEETPSLLKKRATPSPIARSSFLSGRKHAPAHEMETVNCLSLGFAATWSKQCTARARPKSVAKCLRLSSVDLRTSRLPCDGPDSGVFPCSSKTSTGALPAEAQHGLGSTTALQAVCVLTAASSRKKTEMISARPRSAARCNADLAFRPSRECKASQGLRGYTAATNRIATWLQQAPHAEGRKLR